MPRLKAKSPAKKTDDVTASAKDETLDLVTKDFDNSWKYCQGSWHTRWQNNYKLYNNQRTNRGYAGITDTFVPMVFGTIETLTSALFGTKPKFSYLPPHDKENQSTDILNALLDFYWEKDQWSVKVIDTGREMLMLGTSIDYFYWCNDHPVLIHVPLRDFFIDPTATTIENARYMGRRYLTTLDELKSFEILDMDKTDEAGNPTGEMKKKYSNLDQLDKSTDGTTPGLPSQEKTDKQNKDDLYGSTLPEGDNNQVEVLEYWTTDKVISVMNRKVKIEDSENYYKAKDRANGSEYPKGLQPFAASRNYVDPSLFYASSDIDFIASQQELLNDVTNQNIDSVTFTLNQMYTLDPAYADKIEEVENLPGAVYPFPKDALMPIQQRPVPPEAFNERMNIKNEIRETTAINEVVKGGNDVTPGQKTATEVNAQVAGAGNRINLKVTQLENEYFHRVARIVLQMIKLYVTEPMMVRIIGKDGAKWEEFDPEEFKGEYEPRIQLDISIQNKKQQQAAQAQEMLAAFLNDPNVNQLELKKLVLSRAFDLDPDEVSTLIVDPQEQQGMGMPGAIDPMTGMPLDPSAMAGLPPQPGAAPPPNGVPGQLNPTPAPPEAPAPPEPIDHATPSIGGAPSGDGAAGIPPEILAQLAAAGIV